MPHLHRICVAPMMKYTDRHFRYLIRLLSRHTLLYTEMVTAAALLHGDPRRHLQYHDNEHPLALQVGGAQPQALAHAAQLAAEFGYDEVNLNVGCPSDRVQAGRFGACLMAEPQLVADCFHTMQAKVDIPITVKTRIGIDDQDSYEHLHYFIQSLADAGCRTVIVHARKAWLNGLSPKENRTVPPLNYAAVYRLKQDFEQLTIVINGGITTWDVAQQHLKQVDGVMLGRQAYSQPYLFAQVDGDFYRQDSASISRRQVIDGMREYMHEQQQQGASWASLLKPLVGLYQGVAGGRHWRRCLTDPQRIKNKGIAVIDEALSYVN